jgi:hypothetical protein
VEFTTIEWDQARLESAREWGSHALAFKYLGFVEHEMCDFCYKGFWVILPYELARHIPGLCLSLLGVVPQRERCPCIIVDYTFSNVNGETKQLSPREVMQFGRALDRILLAILQAPASQGPVYIIKVDLTDGFYRIPLRADDAPKLGLTLPTLPGEEPLVAIPLTLPMGWTESPPWFSSMTKTVTDLANDYLGSTWDPPAHQLEHLATTQPWATHSNKLVITEPHRPPTTPPAHVHCLPTLAPRPNHCGHRDHPMMHADVFVDDEIVVAQGGPARL